MKVLYFFQSPNASTILSKMIIPQLDQDRHGAEVAGMFFFADTVFFFLPENPIGKELIRLSEKLGFFIICCDYCCEQRDISGRLYPKVEEGCFPDVYRRAGEHGVEMVISL